ncbi:hypothetical protein [Nonomuraea sp. NPDC050310]|uniref:hypothetical protein n=1 Tax=Nonomuraea sp. NPDC050310 TaxID=3154935 RepID=UPI0033FC84F0
MLFTTLALGILCVGAGVLLTLFDQPRLYDTPTSYALVLLSKPFLLIVGGGCMMLGSVAAALGCRFATSPPTESR